MADREFVFGRPDVQKLLRENFVTVAGDDWYQRRQDDELGRFFREVADQGPRKGAGGGTRQGRYAFTASGKLLGFNNNRDPERILKMLRDSLAQFEALPASERDPGSVKIAPLKHEELDRNFARVPPEGGLVVKVHTRVLEQDDQTGVWRPCGTPGENTDNYHHNGFGVATDHLWIRPGEVAGLIASAAGKPFPPAIATRLARFHLVDNTRGEPTHWSRDEIKSLDLTARPVPGQDGRLRITGTFHLETNDGRRGYEGEIDGYLDYNPKDQAVRRFDLVAIGKHWGQGAYTGGARPGKAPLGIAFTLGDPSQAEDRVPPQGIRWVDGYYEAEKR